MYMRQRRRPINRIVNKSNDVILRNTSKQIKDGEDISSITLYKLIDKNYGGAQPYEEGYIYEDIS